MKTQRATQFRDFIIVLVGAAGVVGFLLYLLSLVVDETWWERNTLLVGTHGFYLFLLPPLLWAFRFRHQDGFQSPTVRKILDNGLILVEPCDWLGHGIGVSIFRASDDLEIFVGCARVMNIQTNRIVQLRLTSAEDDEVSTIKEMADFRKDLVIKPGHMT
ncbi:hypothetical protein HCZ30_00670 [Marivivens donghaensis]|uniref:Bacterial Pleckstrin homology domain-containing protein n=1 Tax=Marivivens donghaensis TaxID=1699413 RepID=A0ABX0VSP9_9RHOB|nr:hypothetical protein [Marivivens donghaensis]NIY70943.1 hypothetical protein [Marivivens donghaensis]